MEARYVTTFGRGHAITEQLVATEPNGEGAWQLVATNAILEHGEGITMCWTWERMPKPASAPNPTLGKYER